MIIKYSRILSVLLISFSLLINGCASTFGYKMGKKVNSRIEIVDPQDYETIEISQKITLYLNDNSSMVGKFDGIIGQNLVLKIGSNIQHIIKLDEINYLEIKTTGDSPVKWLGLGIGLVVDYVLFLIALVIAVCGTGIEECDG